MSSRFGPAWGMLLLLFFTLPCRAELPEQVLTAAARVAVQDGGRVKPLDTFARFTLLQLSGRSTFQPEDGPAVSALGWLLECLLDPALARTRAVLLIENPEVMESIGLKHEKPRERFSFDGLSPSRSIVVSLARQFAALPEESRSPAQKQVLQLAHNLRLFESLTRTLTPFMVQSGAPGVGALLEQAQQAAKPASSLSPAMILALEQSDALALLPPVGAAAAVWLSPAGLLRQILEGRPMSPAQADALQALDTIANAAQEPATLAQGFHALSEAARAEQGGHREYRQIPLEVFFYRLQPFRWSLMLYGLAFLMCALLWLFPHQRVLCALCVAAAVAPGLLHVAGIVLRCVIRARPPVSTLYETILFVTAVAVAVALLIEWMNRRRVALGVAATLGVVGLFLANKYEAIDRGDTMPNLIAVLDTNFWLATHVTTVTMGYAAGLLASAIAHLYVVCKAFGLRRQDEEFFRSLTRMVYGVFCFGLLFATVGTVLGGVWATESWGRFWGWDPKENGALMIVLWGLAVLHARLGGYLRDYGIQLAAIFGGVIVAFSWFGVNLLGVGLHSYGFTSGIQTALRQFYLFESFVLTIAAFGWLREQGIVRLHRPAGRD